MADPATQHAAWIDSLLAAAKRADDWINARDPQPPAAPPPDAPPVTPAVPWYHRAAQAVGLDDDLTAIAGAAGAAGDWVQAHIPAETKARLDAYQQRETARAAADAQARRAALAPIVDPVKRLFTSAPVRQYGRTLLDEAAPLWTPSPQVAATGELVKQAVTARSRAARRQLSGPLATPLNLPEAVLGEALPNFALDTGVDSTTPLGAALNLDVPLHAALPALAHAAGPAAHLAGMPPGLAREIEQAAKGIRAYHASPHDFDKFDLSKIGTGQGAATYGHGLYFAENPAVTDDYLRSFSAGRDRPVEGGGRLPDWAARALTADQTIGAHRQKVDNLLAEFKERIFGAEARVARKEGQWWNDQSILPGLHEVVLGLENVKRGAPIKSAARTYEVNLNVDPAHLLDWNKPVLDQPHVLDALQRAGFRADPARGRVGGHEGVRGAQAYGMLREQLNPQDAWVPEHEHGAAASQYLASQGIPGHRYLDQGSRNLPRLDWAQGLVDDTRAQLALPPGQWRDYPANYRPEYVTEKLQEQLATAERELAEAQRASHNYVMYDDSKIDILKKYGLLPFAAGAGLAGAAASDDGTDDGSSGWLGGGLSALGGLAAMPIFPGGRRPSLNRASRAAVEEAQAYLHYLYNLHGGVSSPELREVLAEAPLLGHAHRVTKDLPIEPAQQSMRRILLPGDQGFDFSPDATSRVHALADIGHALPHQANWGGATDPTMLPAFNHDRRAAELFGRMFASASPRTSVAKNALENLNIWRDFLRTPGRPFTDDRLRALGVGNVRSKTDNITRAILGFDPSGEKVDLFTDYMAGRANLPVPDVHGLYGIGSAHGSIDNVLPELRDLVQYHYGIPRTGALDPKDYVHLLTDAFGRTLQSYDPTQRMGPLFGTTWEGIRAQKGLPFQGGMIDLYEREGLTEPGAMFNDRALSDAIKYWGAR